MVELMSPAGSLEGAKIAIENGADSLYAGVSNLSLRPRRVEFEKGDFKKLVDFAHGEGKKIYAVLNVFLKPEDLSLFKKEVEEVYQNGADGIICADVGVISYIRQNFPGLPIHISVQNSVTNPQAAKFYEDLGASVIVVSRSLDRIEDIEKIKKSVRADIEVFIHGGICYHYDGDCFLSSYWSQEMLFDRFLGKERLFGQNNAKGECHLICKREFTLSKNGHKLSEGRLLRRPDLIGLSNLPLYIEMGVKIFKLEGRAMPVSYVAKATRLYRKAIDLYFENPEQYLVPEEWQADLEEILMARRQYERNWDIK